MQTDRPADFIAYVADNQAKLRRFAVELCRDPHEAEDIVSEVFLRAWARWEHLGAVGNVHAYVRRMIVNEFITRYRRRHRVTLVDAVDELLEPVPDHAPEWDDRATFAAHIAALPPRQRASVYLRYYADSSDHDIAAALDCSVGTVRSNISRGMRNLRLALAQDRSAVVRSDILRVRHPAA
jgi:RNA polymerase sigma-70 factor (sigma-E family)